MSSKCPCHKKKQSLLLKCAQKDCTAVWWHAVCFGFNSTISKQKLEELGDWTCPICITNTLKLCNNDNNELIAKVEEQVNNLKVEVNDLKDFKQEFSDIVKLQRNQKTRPLWSDIVANNKDGTTKSFVSSVAKEVVHHSKVIADREN